MAKVSWATPDQQQSAVDNLDDYHKTALKGRKETKIWFEKFEVRWVEKFPMKGELVEEGKLGKHVLEPDYVLTDSEAEVFSKATTFRSQQIRTLFRYHRGKCCGDVGAGVGGGNKNGVTHAAKAFVTKQRRAHKRVEVFYQLNQGWLDPKIAEAVDEYRLSVEGRGAEESDGGESDEEVASGEDKEGKVALKESRNDGAKKRGWNLKVRANVIQREFEQASEETLKAVDEVLAKEKAKIDRDTNLEISGSGLARDPALRKDALDRSQAFMVENRRTLWNQAAMATITIGVAPDPGNPGKLKSIVIATGRNTDGLLFTDVEPGFTKQAVHPLRAWARTNLFGADQVAAAVAKHQEQLWKLNAGEEEIGMGISEASTAQGAEGPSPALSNIQPTVQQETSKSGSIPTSQTPNPIPHTSKPAPPTNTKQASISKTHTSSNATPGSTKKTNPSSLSQVLPTKMDGDTSTPAPNASATTPGPREDKTLAAQLDPPVITNAESNRNPGLQPPLTTLPIITISALTTPHSSGTYPVLPKPAQIPSQGPTEPIEKGLEHAGIVVAGSACANAGAGEQSNDADADPNMGGIGGGGAGLGDEDLEENSGADVDLRDKGTEEESEREADLGDEDMEDEGSIGDAADAAFDGAEFWATLKTNIPNPPEKSTSTKSKKAKAPPKKKRKTKAKGPVVTTTGTSDANEVKTTARKKGATSSEGAPANDQVDERRSSKRKLPPVSEASAEEGRSKRNRVSVTLGDGSTFSRPTRNTRAVQADSSKSGRSGKEAMKKGRKGK